MFHRIGAAAYKADLTNTIAICKLLGHPETRFRSIHVAGTNGKGSSSHMLAAIFQAAGYKTGLYTSPHLKDFRERIKINGKPIAQAKVIRFVKEQRSAFDRIKPSFFEWTVGLAFSHFAEQEVDIAVIEVGLGGRLDSTNVIKPLASLITNIGYDHMALLGHTLEQIAGEKAGIIKTGVPVIISQRQRRVARVFEEGARRKNAPLVFAEQLFRPVISAYSPAKKLTEYTFGADKREIKVLSDMSGTYQSANISGVLAAIEALRPVLPVSAAAVATGLKHVQKLTGLRGRWEILSKRPRVICDTGHNEAGIREVAACVEREYRSRIVRGRLHVVFGVVNDKDPGKLFAILRKSRHFRGAAFYFCKPAIPRGMNAQVLLDSAIKNKLGGQVYASVRKALAAAKRAARPGELVFVGGSTFTVAEIL